MRSDATGKLGTAGIPLGMKEEQQRWYISDQI